MQQTSVLERPYGTWPSPLSAAAIASQNVGLGWLACDGQDVYWLESRPQEAGRSVLVRLDRQGEVADVTAEDANVRTRVHEYGGGACVVDAGEAFYVNFSDQRVYRQRHGGPGVPVTHEEAVRYADLVVDRRGQRLFCVREDHRVGGEPLNALVAIDLRTSAEVTVVATGHDFYSTPRLAPDGASLAWLAWRHPNMPWDGTELWVASVDEHGVSGARIVAGARAESVTQPGWSRGGDLYFVSDRDGWWRFYRIDSDVLAATHGTPGVPAATAVLPEPPAETEFGRAQWVLGTRIWTFVDDLTIVASCSSRGHAGLMAIDVRGGTWEQMDLGYESLDNVVARDGDLFFIGASATALAAVLEVPAGTRSVRQVRRSSTLEIADADVSRAERIAFPSPDGVDVYAFYYPPRNRLYGGTPGDRPPLIVISHGGPTDGAHAWLRPSTQFWTTRGFAVVDVDYRGSTGYGRGYRERLAGRWGVVDVEDCVGAARCLVAQGEVDPERLIIRGGSAGGYTTLAALAFHPGVFMAGASYYGISDLEMLARDTHKFESHYTDWLVGPYPEARETYRARSPLHAADRMVCPLILFHGAEDRAVPLNQAEVMASTLRAKGVPVALLVFEGEQHGFRNASTVIRALEAELWFYGTVLGFAPADEIEPVEIENLHRPESNP